MLKSFIRFGLIGGLALGLSGCNIIHTTTQEMLYSPQYVNYIGSDGSVPVEIIGNPLGESNQAKQKLLDAIYLPHWIIPRKLHVVKAVDAGQYHRLVIAFYPVSPFASGEAICADPKTETSKPGSHLKIIAALCSGDDNVTSATAEGDMAFDLNDPVFVEFLNQLILETIPANNQEHDTTDCQKSPCG